LFSFTLDRTSAGAHQFVQDGFYHLDDNVSRMIKGLSQTMCFLFFFSSYEFAGKLGSPETNKYISLQPRHVFFTTTGGIGVILEADSPTASLLRAAQQALAEKAEGIGAPSHARYRAPANTKGRSDADKASFGFLDGDLLEQGLEQLESGGAILGGERDIKLREVLEALQDRH
jgi:DNA damage-binding protein 1